jgi:limonene-1,2-epoxide hydrolase
MSAEPERVVREFCDAWSRRDADELGRYFSEDGVYHNIPMAPLVGVESIRQFIATFVSAVETLDFEVLQLASSGPLVFTERVDHFVLADGKTVDLPVTGVFEVRAGKIAAWRDYFDLGMWAKQAGIPVAALESFVGG